MNLPNNTVVAIVAGGLLLAGCSTLPSSAELDRQALAAVKASFRDEGIAKVARLDQDLAQAACSSATPPPDDVAQRIMLDARNTVKWPVGGAFIGDWREGEKLAQNGRGMTWTDSAASTSANGGSCYNCHQLSAAELSHGTIGPSLWRYGKQRGVNDPAAPTAKPIVEYTWTKLFNAKSYNACTSMPRFGHFGLLDEKQLRDLMALLLDPKSPVNQ